ncbi:MAG: hypothetical protein HZB42_11205 [Sphingobacteriales bacterium]|nr:hypothetical protein [Sphingobacteriales bacterium]
MENERGWDSQVKKYFLKIIRSVSLGLLWLMACAVAGIYFKLAWLHGQPVIYTILFYAGMIVTLYFLARYLYNTWKEG